MPIRRNNSIMKYVIYLIAMICLFTSSPPSTDNNNNGVSFFINSRFISLPSLITYANGKFVHDVGGDFDGDTFRSGAFSAPPW